MKKIAKIILSLALLFILAKPAFANDKTTIHFFWANGCPHCAKEEIFLEKLAKKYPEIEIIDYEVSQSRKNSQLLMEFGKKLSADVSGVPFTVIGDQYVSGYLSDEITGAKIEEIIIENLGENQKENQTQSLEKEEINLPILGNVKLKSLSLPLLTFLIALLDGFNPCAMWTLLFLISLLLGMKNRKRMWILGIAFIASSAFVYFLFLSAWLNLFLFLGFVTWVRVLVGTGALLAGGYYLKDYFTNKDGGCQTEKDEKRKKIFENLKKITLKKQLLIALLGIILLAFAVNLVELICSAGLPAIYTQILALSNLPKWQYYLYLLFYIFIFMLDDLAVFFIAMTTLKAVGIEGKYARYSHLVGGILITIIGLIMLIKPELLMFG